MLVVCKLLAFGVFAIAGMAAVRTANFHPVLSAGVGGVFASLPLLMSLYLGIENATEVGEEVIDGTAVIARGLAVAVLLTVAVYLGVSGIALGTLGASALGTSDAPLFDAGAIFLGRWNSPLILFAAVASIGTSINGIYMTFTRFLFAMGRDGVFPSAFARIHPRWATPHVAVTAVFALALLGLLLPTSLVFLFPSVTVPTLLKYISTCWSAWRLADRNPELLEGARFRLTRVAVRRWSGAGILCGSALVVAGLGADRRPYALLAVWFAVGILFWVVRGQRMSGSRHSKLRMLP